jgi:hypothetical protein
MCISRTGSTGVFDYRLHAGVVESNAREMMRPVGLEV